MPKVAEIYRRPVAVDLFAGAGGFSLGMEQAGFDVLVAVEHDPIHAATYAFNFPLTEVLCANASTVSSREIKEAAYRSWAAHAWHSPQHPSTRHFAVAGEPPHASGSPAPRPLWNGQIDLIFGGPPCQGFSIMGKRDLKDERNSLIFHFYRLVNELKPCYFLMENVPGMAVGEHKLWVKELRSKFEAAGYHVRSQILNAAEFGVPQKRQRLFVLGAADGAKAVFFPEPQATKLVTVEDAIADLPDLDDFPELVATDEVLLSKVQLLARERKTSFYAQVLRNQSTDDDNLSYPRLWNPQLLTSSMRTQHNEECIRRFEATLPNEREPISHLRRLDLHGLCHTLRAGTGSERGSYTSPRPIHPIKPRVISVREAARLHSFPDWFRFHQTKWHGFRQVGNAVPPLLARAIGHQIIASLSVIPLMPREPLKLGDQKLLRLKPSEAVKYFLNPRSDFIPN